MLYTGIFVLVIIAAAGMQKWFNSRAKDPDGRLSLSAHDRIILGTVVAGLFALLLVGQIHLHGINNPWIIVTPVVLGVTTLLRHQARNKKK